MNIYDLDEIKVLCKMIKYKNKFTPDILKKLILRCSHTYQLFLVHCLAPLTLYSLSVYHLMVSTPK